LGKEGRRTGPYGEEGGIRLYKQKRQVGQGKGGFCPSDKLDSVVAGTKLREEWV